MRTEPEVTPEEIPPPYHVTPELDWRSASPAFHRFIRAFFINTMALSRGELDFRFLEELTPAEVREARRYLLDNLASGHVGIIEGIGLLGDADSAKRLDECLQRQTNLSRRISMGRALYRLRQDPQFPDLLEAMVRSDSATLRQAHLDDVLFLEDDRALTFLLRLLDDSDSLVRRMALSWLNGLEDEVHYLTPTFPHDAQYYRTRRSDAELMGRMVRNLGSDPAAWPVRT